MRIRLILSALLAVLAAGCAHPHVASALNAARAAGQQPLQRFEFARPEMGVPFQIILYAKSDFIATNAAESAFARVQQLNSILSDYDTDSELNRLSQTSGKGERVRVSSDLWKMLVRSQLVAKQSDGGFDVTVGPIVALWRKARREKRLPDPAHLQDARAAVGYENMRLYAADHSVELLKKNMRLDLGAIAKGYAADEAIAVLKRFNIQSALAAAVGDIAFSKAPPGSAGWEIEVARFDASPETNRLYTVLSNGAISTSGDAGQRLEIDGKRYSHIVDPKTGIGLTDHSLVTIIAPDCITADSLATAVSVVGPAKGLKLIAKYPGVSARIVRESGNKIEIIESPRWKDSAPATSRPPL